MSIRGDFASFLIALSRGDRDDAGWQRMVDTHYADARLESIRVEVVRLDIAGQLTPAALERFATELLANP